MEENGVGNSKLLERNDEKPKMEIAFCSISSINFEAKEYKAHLNFHCVVLKDAGIIPRKGYGYTRTT